MTDEDEMTDQDYITKLLKQKAREQRKSQRELSDVEEEKQVEIEEFRDSLVTSNALE